jgi:hypothetical protein
MTTATKHEGSSRRQSVESIGFLGLLLLNLGVDHYWPGSVSATIVRYVFFGVATVALAARIRAGYLRRRPHWTVTSWLRYLRLAAMPVIALSLVLYLSSFDMHSNALGAPHSTTRAVIAAALVAMMLLGVIGLIVAMDWLAKGEPSEQFTRTRWFQRRRAPG